MVCNVSKKFIDTLVFRQMWLERIWAAIPATVIEDRSEMISVYVAPGTIFAGPACTRQEYLRVAARGEWNLTYYEWAAQHDVWTSVPGETCSIWTMWTDPDWFHLGWKVNLQTPIKRTDIGFDTTDHVLDVVIGTDLNSWTWKDEDEFAEAIELGLFTISDSEHIRQEAMRVAKEALTSRREQLQRWVEWRPPAAWELPVLAGQWKEV
jgi:hypothetical protein